MWAFVTAKDNSYVSLLLDIPWVRSVDSNLFIQKKEIHIRDSKKREAISQISYSITPSEYTYFQTNSKGRVNVNELSSKKDIQHEDGDSYEEESDDESFNHVI